MSGLSRLEKLLLRPGSTEASYGYIESLIVSKIKAKALTSPTNEDSLADLIDLLRLCLERAGTGWAVVVSKRIAKSVVLDTLMLVNGVDAPSNAVLGSLTRLLGAFPVIGQCRFSDILKQVMRILKNSVAVSVNLFRLISALQTVRPITGVSEQEICTATLAFLSIAQDSATALACLDVLDKFSDFVFRDTQVINTTVGLINFTLTRFRVDIDVRALAQKVLRKIQASPESDVKFFASNSDSNNKPLTETVLDDIAESAESVSGSGESDAEDDSTMPQKDVDDSSPRSSCPSLA